MNTIEAYILGYLGGSAVSLLFFNYCVNRYLALIEFEGEVPFSTHVWIAILAILWPLSVPLIVGRAAYTLMLEARGDE